MEALAHDQAIIRHGQHKRARGLVSLGHFLRHFFEMCVAMCVGFGVGDVLYLWAAGQLGYAAPFSQLPELSVLVITFNMTASMVAWMRFRGMEWRPTKHWQPPRD